MAVHTTFQHGIQLTRNLTLNESIYYALFYTYYGFTLWGRVKRIHAQELKLNIHASHLFGHILHQAL